MVLPPILVSTARRVGTACHPPAGLDERPGTWQVCVQKSPLHCSTELQTEFPFPKEETLLGDKRTGVRFMEQRRGVGPYVVTLCPSCHSPERRAQRGEETRTLRPTAGLAPGLPCVPVLPQTAGARGREHRCRPARPPSQAQLHLKVSAAFSGACEGEGIPPVLEADRAVRA